MQAVLLVGLGRERGGGWPLPTHQLHAVARGRQAAADALHPLVETQVGGDGKKQARKSFWGQRRGNYTVRKRTSVIFSKFTLTAPRLAVTLADALEHFES